MKGIRYLLAGFFLLWMMTACNHPLKKQQKGNFDSSKPMPDNSNATFSMDTTFRDYRFGVFTRGDASVRNLFISIGSIKDTTRADTIVERDFKGVIADVAVSDLDGDGQPELYVISISAGTDRYGKVYGFAIQPKGAVKINTDAIDSLLGTDYEGRDSFYIQGKELVRSYPEMKEGQMDVVLATDKRKTIHYQLVKSGNAYTLKTK